MSEIDNGGTAFPVSQDTAHFPGMTLRQWYAGMALQGHLSNPATTENPAFCRIGLSYECYKVADAMIRAGKGEK